jgi:predicted nucleotidyltransferase
MIGLNIATAEFMDLCRQNDVKVISIFGSAARGEATDQSDIDLLVEFSKRKSLLDLVSLERKISAIFGKKVDLLTEAALSPYIRERIRKDLQIVYEA